MPSKAAEPARRDNTTPSCMTCNRRKVKCNRVTHPCAPCKKSGLECAFPEPSRKRARRKPPTPSPEATHALARDNAPSSTEASTGAECAPSAVRRMFGGIGYEGTRDVGSPRMRKEPTNSTFQASPSESPRHSSFIFQSRQRPDSELLELSSAQATTVWDAYKKHVDPIAKVFHCESTFTRWTHDDSSGWGGKTFHLHRDSDRCLFRAVCFVTAVATDGADLLWSSQLRGESLIQRFRDDVETALGEINFMRSHELGILQALVLYLIALQSLGQDETAWCMLGMVIRVASKLGLPQDIGDGTAGGALTPYELEMRRRLWWAIIALDARVTRILGRTGYLSHNFNDVPRPADVDDSQVHPTMTEIPEGPPGLSESVYIRYRATLSDVLPFIYATGNAQDKCTGLIEMIDDAERQIEDQFIQYCDKSVPLHLLTYVAGKGYIKRVKLAMYSIYPTTAGIEMQTPYAPEAFLLAKESMDNFLVLWTDPGLRSWQWHWKDFFGWHTFRILIQEIAKGSSCSKVLEAWRLVKKVVALLVPTLKLGEEKARLVGDLRMLIEAGDVRSEALPLRATGSMVKSIRPGIGTNPHNAMFPGMDKSSQIDPATGDGGDDGKGEIIEFDLESMNWIEIDRLLVQLGTYRGS